jgi:hypothetical protein
MMNDKNWIFEAEWEIWYQDTFDRDTPRNKEITGQGLLEGLIELWARHLFETVKSDGKMGFSRFNLWLKQERRSIEIAGDMMAQSRLRRWVCGSNRNTTQGYKEVADLALLSLIAEKHLDLFLQGDTNEKILSIVNSSKNRDDFSNQLSTVK